MTLLRAAENTGWLILNNVMRLVIALVVGVWVAGYLGFDRSADAELCDAQIARTDAVVVQLEKFVGGDI